MKAPPIPGTRKFQSPKTRGEKVLKGGQPPKNRVISSKTGEGPPLRFVPFTIDDVFNQKTGKLLFADSMDPYTGELIFPGEKPAVLSVRERGGTAPAIKAGADSGPVGPGTVIRLQRHNGKPIEVTAAKFLEGVNRLETDLNRRGETLRDKATGKIRTTPTKKTSRVDNLPARMGLLRDNFRLPASLASIRATPRFSPALQDARQRHAEALRRAPEVLSALRRPPTSQPTSSVGQAAGTTTPQPTSSGGQTGGTTTSRRSLQQTVQPGLPTGRNDVATEDPAARLKRLAEERQAAMTESLMAKPAQAFRLEHPWERELGDRETFAVVLGASLKTFNDAENTTTEYRHKINVSGGASIGAVIVGNEATVMRMDSLSAIPTPRSPDQQMMTKTVVQVLGEDVFTIEEKRDGELQVPSSGGGDGLYTYGTTVAVETNFMVGPVPVGVRLGVTGDVGLKYHFLLSPIAIDSAVAPTAGLEGFAEAYVDAGLAEAGAGVSLLFLRLDLPIYGRVELDPVNMGLATTLGIDVEISALDGKVYLFVDSCGFRYELTVFDWEGLSERWNLLGPYSYIVPFHPNRSLGVAITSIAFDRSKDRTDGVWANASYAGYTEGRVHLPLDDARFLPFPATIPMGNPVNPNWNMSGRKYSNIPDGYTPVELTFFQLVEFQFIGSMKLTLPRLVRTYLLVDLKQKKIDGLDGTTRDIVEGTAVPFSVVQGPFTIGGTVNVSELRDGSRTVRPQVGAILPAGTRPSLRGNTPAIRKRH